ncbi:MAG: hypothetical protein V5B35_02695 [Candidatus Accumulibacter necessarius]|jgi:hypothetical protein
MTKAARQHQALRRIDAETVSIRLQRDWSALAKTAQLRRTAASHLLGHLLACLPAGARGADLLAETTLGRLLAAVDADLLLKSEVRETSRLLDRALLWLHEQEVIRLNKGLAVFRPAMTIRLDADWKRQFRNPTSRRSNCITTNRWCRFTSWPSTCSAACRRWPMPCA